MNSSLFTNTTPDEIALLNFLEDPSLVNQLLQSFNSTTTSATSTTSTTSTVATEDSSKETVKSTVNSSCTEGTDNISWRITFKDENKLLNDYSFQTLIKFKGASASERVPSELYSSVKYTLSHQIKGSFLKDMREIECRLKVVDSKDGKEITQNSKPIIKDETNLLCTSSKNDSKKQHKKNLFYDKENNQNSLLGSGKIQLTSCSYHHEKARFAFSLEFYCQGSLLLSKMSNPFVVKARKPNKKRNASEVTSEETVTPSPILEPVNKKAKTTTIENIEIDDFADFNLNKSSDLQMFEKRLDELIAYLPANPEERETAIALLQKVAKSLETAQTNETNTTKAFDVSLVNPFFPSIGSPLSATTQSILAYDTNTSNPWNMEPTITNVDISNFLGQTTANL